MTEGTTAVVVPDTAVISVNAELVSSVISTIAVSLVVDSLMVVTAVVVDTIDSVAVTSVNGSKEKMRSCA